ELMQVVLAGNHSLRCEDVAAKVVGQLRSQGVGYDFSLEGPDVRLEREVISHQRHMGLLRGLDFKRVGPGARGASEIFEYDHRDLAAGGRPEDRRVAKIIVRAGSKELGFQREWV